MGYHMVASGRDILFFNWRDQIVITLATAWFFVLGIGFISLCLFALALPSIIIALKTGCRVKKKVFPGIPWRDAVLYYLSASIVYAIWLQRCLYHGESLFVVLSVWLGTCAFYLFLKESGKKVVD